MESYIAGMKIHLTLRSAPSANGILSWWNPLGKNKLEHKAVDDPFRVTTPLQLVTKGKGSRRVVDVDHLVAKRTTIRAVQRRRRVTDLQHDIPLGSLAQTPINVCCADDARLCLLCTAVPRRSETGCGSSSVIRHIGGLTI